MGTYVGCGVATELTVRKWNYSKSEIVKEMEKELDLSIYNITESEREIHFNIKEDIFDKNILPFIIEQMEDLARVRKAIDEDIQILKEFNSFREFQKEYRNNDDREYNILINTLLEYEWDLGKISTLSNEFNVNGIALLYMYNGNTIMEEYKSLFYYLRKNIIKGSKNPLRTAFIIDFV